MAGKRRILPLQRQATPAVQSEPVNMGLSSVSGSPVLYRLMTWLSPSYPIGAFSYSSGIEWAVECGDIASVDSMRSWLAVMMADGTGFCDGVLFTHAHRAVQSDAETDLRAVAELAAALVPTRERFLETTAMGRAFVEATRTAWPCPALDKLGVIWDGAIAYPIAVGIAAAGHDIPLNHALPAYLHAVLANWISAGIRLVPLGQTDGQCILAALENVVASTIQSASIASLDDIGSAAFRADLATAKHEAQYTRLFRS